MISDGDLYRLAIFLGSCAMMMIVLYHFLDVNASDEETPDTVAVPAKSSKSESTTTSSSGGAAGSAESGKAK